MAAHPELCIQHRGVTLPEPENNNPIATIKLYKSDNASTRITGGNLQIWTSPNNYQYQRQSVSFQFQDTTETAAEDIRDINNTLITRAGDPVRVLTLSGLNLSDPYVLVTTDFSDAAAATSSMRPPTCCALTMQAMRRSRASIQTARQSTTRSRPISATGG